MKNPLAELLIALRTSRTTIGSIDRRLAELEAEREKITAIPPHRDDIVDALARGFDSYDALFKQRLGWFLNPDNLAAPGSYQQLERALPIVELPTFKPAFSTIGTGGNFDHRSQAASACALAWAIGPLVRPRLAALVDELLPQAHKGMKATERNAMLDKLDAERASLESQRAELVEQLQQARAAAGE